MFRSWIWPNSSLPLCKQPRMLLVKISAFWVAAAVFLVMACGRQETEKQNSHSDLEALKEARHQFQMMAQSWPDSLKREEALLQCRHLEGKPDSLLDACLKLDPDFLARSIELYGAAYRYALEMDPETRLPETIGKGGFARSFNFFLRSHYRRQHGQPILAVREIDSALVHAPRQAAYWAAKADAHIALHQDEKAVLSLEKEIQLRKRPQLAWEKMSACQLQMGDTLAAIQTLGEILKQHSTMEKSAETAGDRQQAGQKLGQFYALRGLLLWEKGRRTEARTSLLNAAKWGDSSGLGLLRQDELKSR